MASVLVIGGGPAGASFATRMAQLGCEVTLIERRAFPRPRLGESLTPGVRPLLAATGAWPAIAAAAFPLARDVRVIWEADEVDRVKAESEGLLVDRGRFDELLLAHAARQGVRVLQPAEITSQTRNGTGWSVEVCHPLGREIIAADLLADARGRSAQAGSQRRRMGRRTLALFAHWRGAGLSQQAMVAAGGQGWFWAVPLPNQRINAQAFIDLDLLGSIPGETLAERYRHLIANSPLAPLLTGGSIEGDVGAADATASLVAEPVTGNMIRLGDAALCLDPISSSGVQKALQTALSGAIVANTLLHRPAAAQHAVAFYRDSLSAAASRHAAWAGGHYATAARHRHHPFWSARARPTADVPNDAMPLDALEIVQLSPQARLTDVPCLGAAFVELRRALVHPDLPEPVAYLAQQPLDALLDFDRPSSLAGLAQIWSRRMPAATAVAICHWLRRNKILVPAGAFGAAA